MNWKIVGKCLLLIYQKLNQPYDDNNFNDNMDDNNNEDNNDDNNNDDNDFL